MQKKLHNKWISWLALFVKCTRVANWRNINRFGRWHAWGEDKWIKGFWWENVKAADRVEDLGVKWIILVLVKEKRRVTASKVIYLPVVQNAGSPWVVNKQLASQGTFFLYLLVQSSPYKCTRELPVSNYFKGLEPPGCQADQRTPFRAQVKNVWSCTFSSPIRCHGVYRKILTLYQSLIL
jgi:hypothetical protein